jgi:hypothetical protein
LWFLRLRVSSVVAARLLAYRLNPTKCSMCAGGFEVDGVGVGRAQRTEP